MKNSNSISIVCGVIGVSLILLKEQIGTSVIHILCNKYVYDGVGNGLRVKIPKASGGLRDVWYITLNDTEGFAIIAGIIFLIIAIIMWLKKSKQK